MILTLLLLASIGPPRRTYHPVTIEALATGKVRDTHVELTGCVSLVKMEADGDRHIRLSAAKHFIVAECIPSLPCSRPKLHDRVTVRGIQRFDGAHKWYECHPVESLKVVGRCTDAAK